MSCTLQHISSIQDVNRVVRLLEDLNVEEEECIDKGFGDNFKFANQWEDDWESSTDETDLNISKTNKQAKPWLQECCVAMSPSEELLVVAKGNKCIFLTKRCETKNDKFFYDLLWSGNLSSKDDDSITCVVCVPLASQQRSSEGNPDWTCIIAGFSSGYIRIFMTNGSQLLSQFLHDAPVVSIKLKTKQYFLTQGMNEVDELLIMYSQAIVTIDGFSLYQSLRACRNQLAKAKASLINEVVDSPSLAYRKWRVTDANKITDIANCGTFTPCFFDRLMTACNVGFNETVRGSAPAFNHFIITGETKFLSVYHALEGSSPPMISDVALAVASKLTSAVLSQFTAAKGWWGMTQEKNTKVPTKPKVEAGTNLSSRYFLHDKHRCSENIVVAPIGKLAVVNDAFNRVFLFDTQTGLMIRMWKGYRDAECGWVVVEEELDNNSKEVSCRRSLFLIIYAPKRGILEIYLTEHGTRVGAFHVGKDCRLIYNGYSYLGQTPSGSNSVLRSCNQINQCILLQMDGLIKAVHIPFHCALSTIHSVQAKDMHLLKRISNIIEKGCLGDMKETCKNLISTFIEIQVPSAQHNAVKCILASSLPEDFLRDCLLKIIKQLTSKLNANEEEDLEFESERQKLIQYCNVQLHLIDTYLSINNVELSARDISAEFNGADENKAVETLLHLTSSECKKFINLINNYNNICIDKKKGLCSYEELSVAAFLGCFHIDIKDGFYKEDGSTSHSLPNIEVKEDLGSDLSIQLGAFFFKNAIDGVLSDGHLSLILEASKLPPKQLLILLIDFSLGGYNILNLQTLYLLHCLVSSMCSLKGGAESIVAELSVGSVCQWWQCVRDKLSQSLMIGQSLVVAYICRSVAIELNCSAQKIKMKDESDIASNGWEAVTVEIEHWNLLIAQLENLVELDCFVHSNHANLILSGEENFTFKQHRHYYDPALCKAGDKHKSTGVENKKVSSRNPFFSVQGVLDAGFGAFAQIVADCLVRQGVPGPCLGVTDAKKVANKGIVVESEDVPEVVTENENYILQSLVTLRETFPYSLDKDVLWLHCAWEAVMIWNEDVEDISMLSSALVHLNCINNSCLQKGLAVMLWKAVFKESVQSLLDLVEKVGKAPKDRLCKKAVGLGYKSLESFLNAAKMLLEKLMEIESSDDPPLQFEPEYIWRRNKSAQRSIVEQALDEPLCNPYMLEHLWCVVTVLYLTMHGCVRGVKPRSLFDTKGKHALTQNLHATPVLSTHFDDKIIADRQQFCINYVTSAVKCHLDLTFEDKEARNDNSNLLWNLNIVLELGKRFQLNEDLLRCHIACNLYAAGFDNDGKEMALYIQDKEMFSVMMIDIIGLRLARSLLQEDVTKNVEVYSRIPTTIYTWLQSIVISDKSTFRAGQPTLSSTFEILQFLHSNTTTKNSKHSKLIRELIECLQYFV